MSASIRKKGQCRESDCLPAAWPGALLANTAPSSLAGTSATHPQCGAIGQVDALPPPLFSTLNAQFIRILLDSQLSPAPALVHCVTARAPSNQHLILKSHVSLVHPRCTRTASTHNRHFKDSR